VMLILNVSGAAVLWFGAGRALLLAERLRQTLAVPTTWPGLDGDFTLDAYGDTQRALHPAEVRGGRFEGLR